VKIVSLSPSLTDIVTALKAEGLLAGISDACEGKEGVIRLGSPKALHLNTLSSLRPDWILADLRDNRIEEIEKIKTFGKVKIFDVKGPEWVCDAIAEIGNLLGRKNEAKALYGPIQEEMRNSKSAFKDRPKKRTALLLWNNPMLTVNFDTYTSRLVECAGGVNVFREESVYEFPVELEDMIEKEPETLFLAAKPAPFTSRHVAEFRRYRLFSKIPIHLIKGRLLARYGPTTLEALKHLRKIYESL
jgi:ABC-type Fe3+-hydroxamate transport system substrate-binding protein